MADRRQRRHAQEQADEQQAQAPETRMQVAARDPPTAAPAQPYGHVRRSAMIRPSRISTMRSHRRSEEHTSELQSLMRISYAVFCLKKKNNNKNTHKDIGNKRTREYNKNRLYEKST